MALVLKPMELMEKLSVLVPRPRVHLVRTHGVLAPNHRFRRAIVPPVEEGEAVEGPEGWRPRGGLVPGTGQVPWAQLLQRVWGVDVLHPGSTAPPMRARAVVATLGKASRGARRERCRTGQRREQG